MNTYAQSLERERMKLGFTQNEMAQKLDMSLSNYKKIITGATSNISLYVAHKMHEMTGKWTFELCGEKNDEIKFIQSFRTLTDTQKRFILGVLDFENDLVEQESNTEDYITVFVPTGNMEDGMIYDSANVIHVNASAYRKKYGDDVFCGIQITSSHLHPVYNAGDILIICRKPVRDGDTGVFFNKASGRVYIRKLLNTNPCILAPVNGYGNIITIDTNNPEDMTNWVKFGYVLCKMRI